MSASNLQSMDLRDRFVGFAFAAADLLVEIDADRRIAFAAGAFRERFSEDAEQFAGRQVRDLVAAEDQAGLEIALSLLAARGRLAPVSLRLANPERTAMAMSGLRLPNRAGISWLTLARLPAPPAAGVTALAGKALFQQSVEARLQSAQPCDVGLLQVDGWSRLAAPAREGLEADIGAALREAAGPGAVAAGMEDGRFGVVGAGLDMGELQSRIGRILTAAGAGRKVEGAHVPAGVARADASASIRAMRFALSCFTSKGVKAVRDSGFGNGLRGFLDTTETRAVAVRHAIERGRFRLVYQPVVRLSDRAVHHFEALLRPHPIPGHQETNTQEFVTFAEAIGLAEMLDTAVLHHVSDALAGSTSRVAVNVSGLSMQSGDFRGRLLELIQVKPHVGQHLLVELTETADIEDVAGAVDTVNRLAEAGVPVCLDDFGAGFAAFRYLKEFQIDFVKIDGSYVQGAKNGARESGFVGAMVDLARCVGARAIAEMIETEAQAGIMSNLGVEFGQGWLFGKPGSLPGSL